MPSPAEINQLLALFNTGRHAETESRARSLLEHYPDSGFVWKLLAISLHMQGKDPLLALRKAAYLLPDDAGVHNNLGSALQDLGQFEDAAASYRRALKLKPDLAMTHNNLGIVLHALGKLSDAVTSFRQALKIEPNIANAHINLGNALKDLGQLDDAVASYRKAVALEPDSAEVHNNLGNLLKELGQFNAAISSYRRAVELKPDFAEAHSNMGNALKELGQFDDAVACCRRAAELKPDFAEAQNNLGNALKELGQFDGAVASYRKAVELKPNFAEAHSNLGNALHELGQFHDAVASCRRAVELKPDFAEAHSNLGNTLKELGQLDGAAASYRRAVELKPDFDEAHYNLGIALRDLGDLDGAVASYRRALELKPKHIKAYSNLLYLYAFTRHVSPEMERSLAANWENIVLNESERTAARNRSFDHPPRAGRKLRVGIVSAELGQHAVAEFLEPILGQLDRSHFHVTLFPTAVRLESRAVRFKELADEYKSLVGLSDSQAADLIRSGHIDILIDTTSHMKDCRLGIFAHRAAPVQCHYIGYHGTTGLTEMDWFIADGELLPSVYDAHFCESIWRLPRLRLAYKGDPSLPESRWTPSQDGTIWLGSFNNLTKVREEALGLWAKVMNAIPKSRLLLKDRLARDPAVQGRIRTELGRHGIDAARVEFASAVPDWTSHMILYDRLDIALDTIPLNSETTAFDALWMGVPLVALEGNWVGGRMASTILKAFGKPEWVARSEDEYVAKVAALARNVEERKLLRSRQRTLMAGSTLCDAKGLTKALEDAFAEMFDQYLERQNERSSITNYVAG